jgi:hypothetical protein
MMLTHSEGLWRIEYRSDLSRAQGPVLPIGYVLEARWNDLEARWNSDVCWLGMLFRTRLTPIELGHVDLETWPEMQELEPFMNRLFEEVWDQEGGVDNGVLRLGSPVVGSKYSMQSSLQFVSADPSVALNDEDAEQSFPALYTRLLGLHGSLAPTLSAPVVPLPQRQKPAAVVMPVRVDVEQVLRAA